MCRRRKGGRCTKGTAGMVYYIAITLHFFFFLIFVQHFSLACLYIVDARNGVQSNSYGRVSLGDVSGFRGGRYSSVEKSENRDEARATIIVTRENAR